MYGLQNGYHAFQSFDRIHSLPMILNKAGIRTGIIGKKHVAPQSIYPFNFSHTEFEESTLQVGRNITRINDLVRQFLTEQPQDQAFFLYVGFHDPHRCGHTHPEYGVFCEKFGNGAPGMGSIPDWKPQYYEPTEVIVPPFVQDTPTARKDLSAQYTAISRLDQGVGLVLKSLEKFNLLDDTLIVFTSDNGIPFPNGRTNLYRSGAAVPLILSGPGVEFGTDDNPVSLLDITPTVLDWFDLKYPEYTLFNHGVKLTGKSLLHSGSNKPIFGSHSLHEVTMYYPKRSVLVENMTLIRNLNHKMPFPIDQDFYLSPSFQDLLHRTAKQIETHWFKSLHRYYYRDQFELYNLTSDPLESRNLAYDEKYAEVFVMMNRWLDAWLNSTADPWRCSPGGVLQDAGKYRDHPTCMPLNNGLV